MIPLNEVQILNGPDDVLSFSQTSQITELEFRRGSLHIRHTKETVWPSVMIETAQQQATFWILGKIDGQWFAAGMERLRPNQQDKPEGDDPAGFISGFVEGRNFGAFNGHTFQRGDPMGFMVVQGNTRLAQDAPLRERSLVVEMAFPPSGTILWTEGQPAAPLPNEPVQAGQPNIMDLQAVVAHIDEMEARIMQRLDDLALGNADIRSAIANVATKDDIVAAREEFVHAVKQLPQQLAAGGAAGALGNALGNMFNRRDAPPAATPKPAAKPRKSRAKQ